MQLDNPDDQLHRPENSLQTGWVFYSKSADNARSDWPLKLTPGTINFWWHGLGYYPSGGGAPYSKQMKRGDFVVMVLADEIIGIGILAAGADWKFVDENGRRRWPVHIEQMFNPPIRRTEIEGGERMIPYSGTVYPLHSAQTNLEVRMMGQSSGPHDSDGSAIA